MTYHRRHREEVRVITAFLQVHHDVEQRDLVPTTLRIQGFKIPRQYEFVVLPAGTGIGQAPLLIRPDVGPA